MKNVLITGINGFVGSSIASKLLSDGGYRVVGLVKEINYKTRSDILDKCSIVYGDLRDINSLMYSMSHYEIDTVFHVGAVAVLRVGNQDPITCYETNILGTLNVLEAARRTGVGKVVVASSDKAYGTYDNLPYVETMGVQASADMYSTSKACTDLICQSYFLTYSFDVSVIRSGNIYGPGDLNMSRLIPKAILRCLDSKPPQVYRGVGEYKREFMYISDVVDAYLIVAERGGAGECYNIGGSGYQTIIDTCDLIVEATGFSGEVEIIKSDFIEIKEQYLDASKIERLGWDCKYNIKEGIQLTVDWYKNFKSAFPSKCIY